MSRCACIGAPDVFLANDAAVRNGIRHSRVRAPADSRRARLASADFREVSPWRSYATMHLWRAAAQAAARTSERTTPEESDAMKAQLLTMSTPDGPFTIIARDGAVLASGWTAVPGELTGQIHPDCCPAGTRPVAGLGGISAAVEEFYAGDPAPPWRCRCCRSPGPFRSHAWDMLRTVAPGHPVTYTEYAELSGNAKAVRAAASACAFNAAALFVPCHRVIRTDGTLGGFRWGLHQGEPAGPRSPPEPFLPPPHGRSNP